MKNIATREEVIAAILSHKNNWYHPNFLAAQSWSDLVSMLEVLCGVSEA
jgi:hypothetical protein